MILGKCFCCPGAQAWVAGRVWVLLWGRQQQTLHLWPHRQPPAGCQWFSQNGPNRFLRQFRFSSSLGWIFQNHRVLEHGHFLDNDFAPSINYCYFLNLCQHLNLVCECQKNSCCVHIRTTPGTMHATKSTSRASSSTSTSPETSSDFFPLFFLLVPSLVPLWFWWLWWPGTTSSSTTPQPCSSSSLTGSSTSQWGRTARYWWRWC